MSPETAGLCRSIAALALLWGLLALFIALSHYCRVWA